ncbi:sensor histidine kinase (plasmid) [Agrobacterium tumefaciens]|uniref:C4-dicarboxylate transport sensor protein n=1 Tax=Agrobacterium tumefaciens TaxID=358 RepID=A0A4D7Z6A1_AGRTU|nr:sensor histidine kinase [Agrobacterium tumefaciens]
MRKKNQSRLRVGLIATLATTFIALAGVAGHGLGRCGAISALIADTGHRLNLFTSTAVLIINRLSSVPGTIELNPDVVSLVGGRGTPSTTETVNRFLYRLSAQLGSDAIFVANERGEVVGSSNTTQQDDSRLGGDIAYRPYFQDALSGFVGRHFSLGEAPDTPGYFVAYPIHDGDRVIGIATVKISLKPVVDAFSLLGKPALIADRDNVVILSSHEDWLYTSLKPISVAERVDLELTGMYGRHRVGEFPFLVDPDVNQASLGLDKIVPPRDGSRAALPDLLVQGQVLAGMDWKLLVFSDVTDIRHQGMIAAALASALAVLLLTLALYMTQRRRAARQKQEAKDALERANAQLEVTVAKRTQALTNANMELRIEMAERIRTEEALRATQNDLVQAAKLTALGELATGITHELTQPLGAIQTLAGNAREFVRLGDLVNAQGNLAIIDQMANKMGSIIDPLRSFARKSPAEPEEADISLAVRNALFLLDARLRTSEIAVTNACDPRVPTVWCNRNRLEQVLVNLIVNAIDAMDESSMRTLVIRTGQLRDGQVSISIEDSGKGFAPDQIGKLFIPFNTTKTTGLGLGLAISRGIAREYGGDLIAKNRPEGGAVLLLVLPHPRSRATV